MAGPYFSLRLAVRAVEAWFLADVKAAAPALAVSERSLPAAPDEESDPKQTIVALARTSKADWLLFLNPDCVLKEGAGARMLKARQQHPEAGMGGGLLLNLDGSEQAGGRRAVPTPWRSFVRAQSP